MGRTTPQVRMLLDQADGYRAHIADLERQLADAEKRVKVAREALTPSEETKYVYSGEFSVEDDYMDEDGNELVRDIDVPWTVIKEIMKAIRERAKLAEAGGEDGE